MTETLTGNRKSDLAVYRYEPHILVELSRNWDCALELFCLNFRVLTWCEREGNISRCCRLARGWLLFQPFVLPSYCFALLQPNPVFGILNTARKCDIIKQSARYNAIHRTIYPLIRTPSLALGPPMTRSCKMLISNPLRVFEICRKLEL